MSWYRKWIGEFAELLVFIVVMIVFRTFVYDWLHVPTSSMAHTLHRGDVVLVRKFAYGCSPLSLVWGLGLRFAPERWKTADNNGVPYIKYRAVQPGDIVCFVDPVTGMNFTKRVIAISGDSFSRVDGKLIVNGHECERVYVGCRNYQSDSGVVGDYDVYLETLHGTGVSYFVQYRQHRHLKDVTESHVPESSFVQMPWGKTEMLWVSVCGDNRSESADSVVEKTNGVIPKYIPESWVIGNVAGVMCSTHLHFVMHEMVSGVTTTWAEWLVRLPKNATLSGIAMARMTSRVGLRFKDGYTAGNSQLHDYNDNKYVDPRKKTQYV
jgi:signal peptidase I